MEAGEGRYIVITCQGKQEGEEGNERTGEQDVFCCVVAVLDTLNFQGLGAMRYIDYPQIYLNPRKSRKPP